LRLEIVQAGEPVLRQTARPLSAEEIRSNAIRKLIADMRETMYEAPGVGLAAPQVGRSLQIAVLEDREDWLKEVPAEQLVERERRPVPFQVLINPKIVESSQEQAEFIEGCLSLPGFSAIVPRARRVRVECLDENGRPKVIDASGWHARILQHEIDHLRGNMYIDRMRSRTFSSLDNFKRFWQAKPIDVVCTELGATRGPATG
jgi:peptide deformylase